MAEQKVKLTQLPEATDTIDTAVLIVNQNETDQQLPVTHFLRAKNNLSELENAEQARANLGVPSVEDVNDKVEYLIDGKSTFLNGATLESERDFIWDDNSKSWYYWTGTFSKEVPAASTPESTGGIGAGKWLSVGDSTLRGELDAEGGAEMVGYGETTVKGALDELNQANSGLYDKDGFNLVGRFLNLSELRSKVPVSAGQIVYVASAASATATEKHYGGGYFQSFDNSTSPIADDGGIVIVPATGTLAWRRINFTEYDAHFWGVKADDVTDNADAIERAMNFARSEKVVIEFPEGNILTSRPIPIYSYTGIRGKGRADTTVFQKTTNTPFEYKNGNTVVYTVNCLVAFIPETWDRASPNMSSFCHTGRLENARFIRQGLQVANISDAPAVGVFLAKAASPVLRNINIEGGVIGLQAFVTFSGVWEMVGITQWNTYGFAGVLIQDFRDGILHNAGTSMSMNLVQVRGYQFGFQIARLQYTTMINCTVEEGYPQVGNAERKVYAYDYIDPFSVTMSGCATEFIAGGQIRVLPFTNPSFRPTLNVEGYIPIDQQNPEVSTPMFYVDSGGSIPMYVVFMGCELSRDTTKPNNAAPIVSGTNAKVIVTGCHGENWTTSSGGVFTRLA